MMTDNNFKITYKVKKAEYDWSSEKFVIESNIKEEEVLWKLPKSLSDNLISESHALKPEELMLYYAEMQKRGLEWEIENFDNLELEIATKQEKISQTFDKALDKQREVFEEKSEELNKALDNFNKIIINKVSESKEFLKPLNDAIDCVKKTDGYSIKSFLEAVDTIIRMNETNPELMNVFVKNYKGDKK